MTYVWKCFLFFFIFFYFSHSPLTQKYLSSGKAKTFLICRALLWFGLGWTDTLSLSQVTGNVKARVASHLVLNCLWGGALTKHVEGCWAHVFHRLNSTVNMGLIFPKTVWVTASISWSTAFLIYPLKAEPFASRHTKLMVPERRKMGESLSLP